MQQQTSYQQNEVSPQNFNDPQTLAPINKNDSTVYQTWYKASLGIE